MMRSLHVFSSLVILASMSAGVLAQTQPGSVFQPPEEQRRLGLPDKAAPAPEVPVAPLSKPRQAQPQSAPLPKVAAPVRKEAPSPTGEWASECVDGAAPGDHQVCQAIVRSAIGNQVALVLSIARTKKNNEIRIQMALPLGFSVQHDVDVTIGDFKTALKVSRCTAQGCLIEQVMPEAFVEALRTQRAGTVRVYTVENKPIDIALPTVGATVALAGSIDK